MNTTDERQIRSGVEPPAPLQRYAQPPFLTRATRRTPAPSKALQLPAEPLAYAGGLDPYTAPLEAADVAHLLRRTCLGAALNRARDWTGRTAGEAIDALIAEATDPALLPLPDPPPWIDEPPPGPDTTQEEFDAFIQLTVERLQNLRSEWMSWLYRGGLRERMTLFWHNHFVTQANDVFFATFVVRYLTRLRTHALGNFRQFVADMGKDPAMLRYLDGGSNRKGDPNENYARELLELFTMGPLDRLGQPNYTQQDIVELARALTGWIIDYVNAESVFVPTRFDDGSKTLMGRSGSFGYDDVQAVLFEEREAQIAFFVCRKLYASFVYAVPNEDVVLEMADLFRSAGFEIQPVLRALLTSTHFFDAQVRGAQIKSPVEQLIGFLIETHSAPNDELFPLLVAFASVSEQLIMDPPNVAGWPGYRSWISTSTLPIRWLLQDALLYGGPGEEPIDLAPLAASLTPEFDSPTAPFILPMVLARHFLSVPLDTLDVGTVEEDFAGDLINNPLPQSIVDAPPLEQNLAKIFLAGVPWYEWDPSGDLGRYLLLAFTRFLMQRPEYQLF